MASCAVGLLGGQRLYCLPEKPERASDPSQLLQRLCQRILAPLTLSLGIQPEPPAQKTIPVPITLRALLQLVEGRLQLEPRWEQIPDEFRDAFQRVILAEVKQAFGDIQATLADPAYSARVNRRLYQHLVIYVVLVCQHLFFHYLSLMEERRALKVFSDCANLVRFSALLTLDCAGFLKIAAIRHRLVLERKALQQCPPEVPAFEDLSPRLTCGASSRLGFSMKYFLQLVTPRTLNMGQKVARDLKELEDIPGLDMNKIRKLDLPTADYGRPLRKADSAATTALGQRKASKAQKVKWAPSGYLKGSKSLPNMRDGKLLADELGIHLTPRPLSPTIQLHWAEAPETDIKGPDALAEDLRRLVYGHLQKGAQGKEEEDEESELPPLIKVLTWRKSNEIHQQQLQRTLYALQREEAFEAKRKKTMISAPASHPQATTVNVKIHDKMVVKAADMLVSERTYVEAVGMEKCLPIYNHLLGEINHAMMKALDANLSEGEEVKAMYKELANTIPRDHTGIHLGPSTEPTADKVDLSQCFASATLTRRKSQQIINEELSKILPAGPFNPAEVTDTLTTPGLPFKKGPVSSSWLRWWKKTFNTDDYLNYLSAKDADFLPVIFHLYNSVEDSEAEAAKGPVSDKVEIQDQGKRKQKTTKEVVELQEFHAGEWNPDSTLETPVCCGYKPEELRLFQRRLERLWTVLHFPEQERLEMAVKYSANQYCLRLPDMLDAWEEAARHIQNRELLLTELEMFEEAASDPNRFFSVQTRAFSLRLEESRTRGRLHTELAYYDSQLRDLLNQIKRMFHDVVTFRGQPYLKKMAWDTVEMLYWLQQERRAAALKKETQRASWRPKSLHPLN